MANHKSALKDYRQSLRRRTRNRSNRSRMRSAIKQFRALMAAGDLEAAKTALSPLLSLIDRTARLGSIHGNAADRTKSRLTRALNGGAV